MNMEEMDEFERDGIPRVSGCSTRALGISSIPSPFDHSQAKMAREGVTWGHYRPLLLLSPYRLIATIAIILPWTRPEGQMDRAWEDLGARLFPQNSELPAATRLSLYVLSRPVIPTRVHVI